MITPDGEVTEETLPAECHSRLNKLYTLIGCSTVAVVRSSEMDMWVDDEGLVNGSPVNLFASLVAKRFGMGHQPYLGIAVFTGSSNEAGQITPLLPDHVATIRVVIQELRAHRIRLAFGYNPRSAKRNHHCLGLSRDH